MLLLFIFDIHFVVVSSFVDVFYFVVVLDSHFLFDVIPLPSVDYRRVLTPILWFRPTRRGVVRDTFICSAIPFLPRGLRPWVGIFYPQGFFALCSFAGVFACVCRGFPGGWRFFFGVCGASY